MELAALCCPTNGLWLFLTLLWVRLHRKTVVFPDLTACTDPGNIVGGAGGGGGGPGPSATSFFSHQLNLRFFLKKTIIFQDSREGPTFSGGGGLNFTRGGGGQRIQITCDSPGVGSDPLSPSGSTHENSLFRCFAHGLKMCMSCALDIIVKLFSLSLFYELVIQLQVDICIDAPRIWSRVWGVGNCWGVCPLCYNDVIYILNDAMDCKNNNNESTASGS